MIYWVHRWFTTLGEPNTSEKEDNMDAEVKRITLTLDNEMLESLSKLKQEKFFDKPHAEMYRFLIQLGIEAANKKGLS